MTARPVDSLAAWLAGLTPRRFVVRPVLSRDPDLPTLWYVLDEAEGEAWEYPHGGVAVAEACRRNVELN